MAIGPEMGMKLRGLHPRPDLSIRKETRRERERERERYQPCRFEGLAFVRRKSLASCINFCSVANERVPDARSKLKHCRNDIIVSQLEAQQRPYHWMGGAAFENSARGLRIPGRAR